MVTKEQLNVLRNYIWTVCEFIVERRMNPHLSAPSKYQTEEFEKKFEELMLKSEKAF